MFFFAVVVALYAVTQQYGISLRVGTTLNINDRVSLLKFKLNQQIKDSIINGKVYPIDNHDYSASYEYDDINNKPITPIMDFDIRKKHGLFKLRALRTTTEREWIEPVRTNVKKSLLKTSKQIKNKLKSDIEADNQTSNEEILPPKLKGIDAFLNANSTDKKKRKKKTENLRNKDGFALNSSSENTFYRRYNIDNLEKHCVKETILCRDLITPILTGQKVNVTQWKELEPTDMVVVRLIQLLKEDTTDYAPEDIYSNLYQISNLQIRLFQWGVDALRLLFDTLSGDHGKRHSFKTIKEGLKLTLNKWHLNFTNLTNLLQQARLFRPPCITYLNNEGSTKTSRGYRYIKTKKPKCPQNKDGECELF